jgi:hypothetical protein
MEVLTGGRSFAEFISSALDATNSFRLVDVGCSNGIHDAFRAFGNRLEAWAFDIDEAECRKLSISERRWLTFHALDLDGMLTLIRLGRR